MRRSTLCRAASTRVTLPRVCKYTFAWGPQHWYNHLLAGMNRVAQRQTQLLQNGYLRFYLLIIVATTVALAVGKLFSAIGTIDAYQRSFDVRFYEWIVAGLIPMGALTAIMSRSRLGAVAALGVVGYSVGFIFVLFSAPDLAMTQFMVETLTVILFVLVFYHLPRFTAFSTRMELGARRRDGFGFRRTHHDHRVDRRGDPALSQNLRLFHRE